MKEFKKNNKISTCCLDNNVYLKCALCVKTAFFSKREKCWKFGNRKPGWPSVVFKNRTLQSNPDPWCNHQQWVPNARHMRGKHRWAGISNGPRLALYIPKPQVFKDLFDHILIFYEGNYTHLTLALGTGKWINLKGRITYV